MGNKILTSNNEHKIFEKIQAEVIYLAELVAFYCSLFSFSKKRIETIDHVALPLPYILQRMMRGEIYMSISRLMDNRKCKDNTNCSLRHFKKADKSVIKEIDKLIKEAKITEYRHKALAHNDLKYYQEDVKFYHSLEKIKDIDFKIRVLFNKIDSRLSKEGYCEEAHDKRVLEIEQIIKSLEKRCKGEI